MIKIFLIFENKKNWVENSDYWIQLTKNIEDKLSDKLHDELTKSFIDKKISILSKDEVLVKKWLCKHGMKP